MTEYIAQCHSGRYDKIVASTEGDSVELVARFGGEYRGEAFLRPDAARTFARGILALADEIDGGEVAEVPKADEPAPSPFAAHVDEAKRLLASTDHTGTDIICLAQILAAYRP